MPILVKLPLGRYTRRLAIKALKSKALRDAPNSKRIRRLVFRRLARPLSRSQRDDEAPTMRDMRGLGRCAKISRIASTATHGHPRNPTDSSGQ